MDDSKKIAEKHVFGNSGFAKYSETNVAETLRSGSGDTHGGRREHSCFRSLKAIGFDAYNLNATYGVAMSITSGRPDDHHIPTVFAWVRKR